MYRPAHLPSSAVILQGRCEGVALPDDDADFTSLDPPLLPRQPHQCVLLADVDLLSASGRLWLDGLYLRARRDSRDDTVTMLSVAAPPTATAASALWVTDCVLQGAGDADGTAIGTQAQAFVNGAWSNRCDRCPPWNPRVCMYDYIAVCGPREVCQPGVPA